MVKILQDEGYDLSPFPLGEVQSQLNNINNIMLDITDKKERQTIQRIKHDAVNDYVRLQLIEMVDSL